MRSMQGPATPAPDGRTRPLLFALLLVAAFALAFAAAGWCAPPLEPPSPHPVDAGPTAGAM